MYGHEPDYVFFNIIVLHNLVIFKTSLMSLLPVFHIEEAISMTFMRTCLHS